jgi:6-phosphogluconolactonase
VTGSITIAATKDDLHATVASALAGMLQGKGEISLALSGGSTPGAVYALLGAAPLSTSVPWSNIHVFWGDERCVPPTSPDSNYRMARESLLDRISIPADNVHRIKGEDSPDRAAALYDNELRQFFRTHPGEFPRFDIVLLGLGADGHTASIFPGTAAETERHRFVIAVQPSAVATQRVTMTLPVINNAANIVFVVSGGAKADIVRDIFMGEEGKYPAQRVKPGNGKVHWYVDRDAARHLR